MRRRASHEAGVWTASNVTTGERADARDRPRDAPRGPAARSRRPECRSVPSSVRPVFGPPRRILNCGECYSFRVSSSLQAAAAHPLVGTHGSTFDIGNCTRKRNSHVAANSESDLGRRSKKESRNSHDTLNTNTVTEQNSQHAELKSQRPDQ